MLRDCKHVEHVKSKAYNTQRIDMLLRSKKMIKRCNVVVCKTYTNALSKPLRAEIAMLNFKHQPSTLLSTSILFPILWVDTLTKVFGGWYGKH